MLYDVYTVITGYYQNTLTDHELVNADSEEEAKKIYKLCHPTRRKVIVKAVKESGILVPDMNTFKKNERIQCLHL